MQDRKLGQLLLQEGLIKEPELNRALSSQKTTNKRLGEILVEMGAIDEISLLRILARQHRTQYLTAKKMSQLSIPEAILKLVPENICEKYELFPVQYKKGEKTLIIVMSDPSNVPAMDEVRFVSGVAIVKPLVALSKVIKSAIAKWYKGDRTAFDQEIELETSAGGDSFEMFGSERTPMLELEEKQEKEEKEELIDFKALIVDEKETEEKPKSETVLGAKAQEQEEAPLVIEEISESEQEKAKEINLEPVEEVIIPSLKPKPEEIKKSFEQKFRRRMVIVERHEQIRRFIIKLFASEGFQIRGFADLEPAYQELAQEEYDSLVIKERYLGEPSAEFEEHFRAQFPKVELCIIKDYGSAMIGETRAYQRLTSSFLETLDVLLGLLELEGHNVQGHSHNLAKYARLIANKLELSSKEVDAITLCAYLHDLGKKGMKPFSILQIDATSDTGEIMEQAEIPLKLLGAAKFPFDIESIIRYQYERWDGRGIPEGLRGEKIPIGARILAVVDSYEFLTNPGDNRPALDISEALEQINRQAGKIFDPKVVEQFMSVIRDDIYLKRVEAVQDKILIADSEIDLTTLLELRLVKEGFGVLLARNGEEALKKAKETKPSLIITEVDLPQKSGLEFISELQKEEEGKAIPFVFLSRRDEPEIVTKSLDLGAEDYITKPIKVDVFCAKIKTMLNRLKAERKVAQKPVGVSGSLSEMSLADIIQILSAGRKTGKIILRNKEQSAEIHMEDGRVINALIDNLKGEEAFYKILYWSEGTFTIDPNIEISERLINLSTDSLMLEGYRRMDEEQHTKEGGDITLDGGEFI